MKWAANPGRNAWNIYEMGSVFSSLNKFQLAPIIALSVLQFSFVKAL